MGGTPDQPLPLRDTFCALAWASSNAGEYNLDPDGVVAFGASLSGLFVGNLATIDDPTPFLADCPHQLSEDDWLQGVMTFGGVLGAPGAMLGESSLIAELIGKSYGMETQWVFENARGLSDVPPAEWANSEQLDEEQRAMARLLPPYSVDGSEPPFLLMAGVDDPIMMDEAQAFASLLETAGVPVQYETLPHTGHGDFGDEVLWQSLVSAFLTDVLAK